MTLFISETELYQQYLQDRAREAYPVNPDIWTGYLHDPRGISQGYRQYTNPSPGLWLQVDDYTLHEDLVVELRPREPESILELSFAMSGNNQTEQVTEGSNFLQAYVQGEVNSGYFQWQAGDRVLKFDIHMEFQFLPWIAHQLEQLPIELAAVLQATDERNYWSDGKTTPAMQAIIQQILTCPYQRIVLKIYLEAKAMELLALRLAEVMGHSTNPRVTSKLRPDQIERIHQAKEILLDNLDNPPSLVALARQVGLNDCTLKQGFRQVFNTTAFGYLQQQRMQWARSLLLDRCLKVKEVARIIGYTNPSQFAAAFKRQFGVSPKDYRLNGRLD